MSKYHVPDVEVSEEKIKETEEILNYVREEQEKSEKVRDLFLKKPQLKKQKELAFSAKLYTFAYAMQWSLLLVFNVFAFLKVQFLALPYFFAFFIFETIILEQGRRLVGKIRYRKSLPFAVLDILGVFVFSYFFIQAVAQLFFTVHIRYLLLLVWAVYTLARKIYIYKNLTYEK